MKNRFLSTFAAIAVALSLSSCQNSNTEQTVSLTDSATTVVEEAVEMKTIAPPEDGWTVEQLNEVMYLNGKPFKLPCTLEELGEGFTIDNLKSNYNYPFGEIGEEFEYTSAVLYYNGNRFGHIHMTSDTNEIWGISQEKVLGNDVELLFINGLSINASKTDVEALLGSSFTKSEINGSYTYNIDETIALSVVYSASLESVDMISDDIFLISYYCYQ